MPAWDNDDQGSGRPGTGSVDAFVHAIACRFEWKTFFLKRPTGNVIHDAHIERVNGITATNPFRRGMGALTDLTGLHVQTIQVIMKAVSVTDLKASLSRYIRVVKRGGEVEITEHGVPVARLVAARGSDERDGERTRRLVTAGVLRMGDGDASWMLRERPVRSKGGSLLGALESDREDRV